MAIIDPKNIMAIIDPKNKVAGTKSMAATEALEKFPPLKRTPYQEAGYKAKCNGDEYDDKFEVLKSNYTFNKGDVVTLFEDDSSSLLRFIREDGKKHFMFLPGGKADNGKLQHELVHMPKGFTKEFRDKIEAALEAKKNKLKVRDLVTPIDPIKSRKYGFFTIQQIDKSGEKVNYGRWQINELRHVTKTELREERNKAAMTIDSLPYPIEPIGELNVVQNKSDPKPLFSDGSRAELERNRRWMEKNGFDLSKFKILK